MKLYYDPMSTTCRPILMFAAEAGIAFDHETMSLFAGEHRGEAFLTLNPNGQVPLLLDGDLKLTECAAILAYLADKAGSEAYPADLAQRARVNAALSWFNTHFHRDYCEFTVYSQVLPHFEGELAATMGQIGRQMAPRWLDVLDRHMIAGNTYVCGNAVSIADYLGVAFVTLGELVGYDLSPWPNVSRWVATMKARPSWALANAGFNGWLASRQLAAA